MYIRCMYVYMCVWTFAVLWQGIHAVRTSDSFSTMALYKSIYLLTCLLTYLLTYLHLYVCMSVLSALLFVFFVSCFHLYILPRMEGWPG